MMESVRLKGIWLAALLLAFTACFTLTAEAAEDISLVKTEQGLLRGSVEEGIVAFRGIPYAAPPVGERRFRPPAPPEVWAGVRDAKILAAGRRKTRISAFSRGREEARIAFI